MPITARYAHTNIVAHDWRKLADFYISVFGCELVPPVRDHHGPWTQALTNVKDARIRGAHLRLPGYTERAPTLEIFEYNHTEQGPTPAINRPGLAHLAFEVDDVHAARDLVIEHGGRDLGEVVTAKVPGAGTITLNYMTDPEGNIFELQHWTK